MCRESHPVTLTRGPVSWLRSVAIARPRWPPALGVKDTNATTCGLVVAGESEHGEDAAPRDRQLPLQTTHSRSEKMSFFSSKLLR